MAPVPTGRSVEVVPVRREGLFRAQPGGEVVARLAGVRGDAGRLMPSDAARHLSLHQAADLLGVHYMTIYRRVRLGILPARKSGGTWMVDPADLERATTTPDRGRRRRGSHPRVSIWQERLQARMLGGDVASSWQVIEAAMASGFEPGEIYVRVLAPSLHAIGASWQSGGVSIDQEHLASSVATTLIGRLGPPVRAPGPQEGRRHRRDAARRASRTRGRDARRHPCRSRLRGPQPGPRHADGVARRRHARCGTLSPRSW